MGRLTERAPKLTAEMSPREPRRARQIVDAERLEVAGIREILGTREVAGRRNERHRNQYAATVGAYDSGHFAYESRRRLARAL